MKKLLIFSVGLAVLVLTASGAFAAPTPTDAAAFAGHEGYVRGQVLVKFEERTPRGGVDE